MKILIEVPFGTTHIINLKPTLMIGFSACFNPFVRVHPYGSCAVEQLLDLFGCDTVCQHFVDVLRLDAVVGGNGFQSSMCLA